MTVPRFCPGELVADDVSNGMRCPIRLRITRCGC
jgi:hypothetical protein